MTGREGRCPLLALCAVSVMLVVVPGPVAAQEDPTRPFIRGQVVDAETRAPLFGAFVFAFGGARAVATDSAGLFALPMELANSYPVTVEQLGYTTLRLTLPESAPREFSTIHLEPNPIALEGLMVLVDGFERRRRRHFGPVRVLDQERLQREERASAYDLVRAQVPLARPCSFEGESLCFPRRGGAQRVNICVDEVPLWEGARALDGYDPAEFYLVEVYDRGREIRMYTRYFMERRLRSGRSLAPLEWGCQRLG